MTDISSTKTVHLDGLTLEVERPRVAAETHQGRCWFPDLLRFSTGELLLNYSVNADTNENQANAQAVWLSTDSGRTFGHQYDVNGFHNAGGEPRISLSDGRIVGTTAYLQPDPPDQMRRFRAHYWTYTDGGRKYAVEPWAVLVEGLPAELEPYPNPSRVWWSRINWFSDIVRMTDGRFVSTISMRFRGDERESTVCVVSDDEGYNWRYVSTIAGPDAVDDATEGFDEPCLMQLESGELMCISRVGRGEDQKLARSFSNDGGNSWSAVDRLPAWSVAPQIQPLENKVLALSTGRPGIYLWLSTDARGQHWQSFDVLDFHNSQAGGDISEMTPQQTTAYTAMVQVAPNRILLAYDRVPFGWGEVPPESGEASRIYLLELIVQRH